MRATQKPNRARGRGNRKPNGNTANRVYDSSGPEGKVRGTPQQIIDKYLSLARDAQTSGARVTAENFLQHAEHYQRILIQATVGQQEQRRDGGQAQDDGDGDGAQADQGPSDRGRGQNGDRAPAQAQRSSQAEGGRDASSDDGDPRQHDGGSAAAQDDSSPLATFDGADGSGESLLVGEDEASASQPVKRRRSNRGRRTASEGGDGGESVNGEPSGNGAAASDEATGGSAGSQKGNGAAAPHEPEPEATAENG